MVGMHGFNIINAITLADVVKPSLKRIPSKLSGKTQIKTVSRIKLNVVLRARQKMAAQAGTKLDVLRSFLYILGTNSIPANKSL